MLILKSILCLATVIAHEARGSNLAEQYAVAQTVINRTNINYLRANTICKTVYKHGRSKKTGKVIYQFENINKAKKPSNKFKILALEYLTMCTQNMIKYSIGSRIYFNRAFKYKGKLHYRKYKTKNSLMLIGKKGQQHGHY